MDEAVRRAQLAHSLRIIERFAPLPPKPLPLPLSRPQVIEAIMRSISRSTLRRATNDELAAIYAALEAAVRRIE